MSELRVNATATAGGTDAYRYVDTLYFTSSGTFVKADYPWLRAIGVKVQGAGGGGGATDDCPSDGDAAAGGGGGGGAYAESFLTDIAGLGASVTVTLGAGGAGGTTGSPNGNDGSKGGNSSFGSGTAYEVYAEGGDGGNKGSDIQGMYGANGGNGGDGAVGDLEIRGEDGGVGVSFGSVTGSIYIQAFGGRGGASHMGLPKRDSLIRTSSGQRTEVGSAGKEYGSGGSGAAAVRKDTTVAPSTAGGDGAKGVVIVELYA